MPTAWTPEAEIPLYRQLKDIFMAAIESGEWQADALIPTESELAAQYGVSKGPIRQALGQLVREGLLGRRQGKGTWVRPQPAEWSTISGLGVAALIGSTGKTHRIEVRQFSLGTAAPAIAAGLRCAPGTPIYRIEICRFAGDEPVALETLHVPRRWLPGLRRSMLEGRDTIYRLLREAGSPNTHSHESLQAVVLDRYEAEVLGVAVGLPAMLLTNRAYGPANVVLVYSFVILRGDYFRISISLPPRAMTELTEAVRPQIVGEIEAWASPAAAEARE